MAKLPTIKELSALIRSIKPCIEDSYIQEGDSLPSIDLTIGWDSDSGSWDYQTGSNEYTGGAYGYPIWAVCSVYRRSNSRSLARDLIADLDGGN